MINHLRIALQHLLNSTNSNNEILDGNYKVGKMDPGKSKCVYITHLKFNGKDEFQSCKWDPAGKVLYVCKENQCPQTEIIFIIKTIKKLGYSIEQII